MNAVEPTTAMVYPQSTASYPSPEEVVAEVIADARHVKNGKAQIGRATRRKAAEVTSALRKAGWRILR